MKKGYIIGALALCMVLVTGVAFAFWAGLINPKSQSDNTISIEIGVGGEVDTTLALSGATDAAGKTLIPLTILPKSNETNVIIVTYNVKWSAVEITGAVGAITVATTSIKIGGTEYYNTAIGNLFIITAEQNKTVTGNDTNGTNVIITIKLNEPTVAQYELIKAQSVVFAWTFTVTDATSANI
jgi:hypothetical protein